MWPPDSKCLPALAVRETCLFSFNKQVYQHYVNRNGIMNHFFLSLPSQFELSLLRTRGTPVNTHLLKQGRSHTEPVIHRCDRPGTKSESIFSCQSRVRVNTTWERESVCVCEGHFLLLPVTCPLQLINKPMMHSGISCKLWNHHFKLLFSFVDQHQLLLSLMSCSYKQFFHWLSVRYHSQLHEKKLKIKLLWLNSRIFYSRSKDAPVRAVIRSPFK